ncbi:hypothetical protein Hanom_Chr04g00369491 [Helianthus anomalus]
MMDLRDGFFCQLGEDKRVSKLDVKSSSCSSIGDVKDCDGETGEWRYENKDLNLMVDSCVECLWMNVDRIIFIIIHVVVMF